MYNGRRSIGRPKAIQRSYKDSNGSFPDQFEVENKEEAKVEKDNVEEFDGDDIDLDADIEMEQESNEKRKQRLATLVLFTECFTLASMFILHNIYASFLFFVSQELMANHHRAIELVQTLKPW